MKELCRHLLLLFVFAAVGTLAAQTTPPVAPVDTKQAVFTEQPTTLDTGKGTLYGTVMLPAKSGACPVVLLISGSGPTDRNGNSPLLNGPNNSLKMVAEGLAAGGIASLRYDKRGIAESGKTLGQEADLRFDDYVNDAVLWSKQLRADKRFTTLTIAGHSEGSLIGMIAARLVGADGYVSIAGLGQRSGQAILEQIRPQLPPELMKAATDAVALIQAGKTADSVPKALDVLFRPGIQPYLASWFKYDPSAEIAKLTVPVLILQGTTDIQVGVPEAKSLAKARPDAKLLIVDGMNHVLKLVPADMQKQVASYSDPALPVAPQLISEMTGFVRTVKVRR